MNINQGVWKCHRGCGQGDFVKLVEVVLNCSPNEAYEWVQHEGQASSVEQLSRALGNLLNTPTLDADNVKRVMSLDHYNDLNSNVMPLWFLKRGFTWDTINQWGIRYDPVMDSVVVPVYQGEQLVGTVTRNSKEGLPKYQNSPNFPRAEILFGKINPNAKRIYLVEGLLDCIYAGQCGYQALSLLGSSISNKQIEILKKHRYGQIVLALDNDEAGKKATTEIIKRLQKAGYLLPQIQTVIWPEGIKDANDCTPEQLREVFEETQVIGFA